MRLPRKSMVLALVAALSVVAAVPNAATAAPPVKDDGQRIWSVRPATLDGKPDSRTHFTLQATPGSTIVDTILITNLSKATVSFNVYGTDAYNTPAGVFDLLAFDRKPVDIGAWIHFPQPLITIAAGKSMAIPFNVALPATATPGDHAGGVVVSLASNSATPGVNLDSRVAVRIYLRVPGDLRPSLAITSVSGKYGGTGNGKTTMSFTVTNPGNIRLRSHVRILIKNVFGQTLASDTPPDLPELLPNATATFTGSFTHVPQHGPLTVTVKLTPYADPLQPVGEAVPGVEKSGYFWAMPWLLLIIVLIVLLILVGLWLLRRRQLMKRIDTAMAVARKDALETAGASR